MKTDKLDNNKKEENEYYDNARKTNYRPKRKRRFKSSGGRRVGGIGGKRSPHTRQRSF